MMEMRMDRLLALQRNIEARADLGWDASFVDRLCVTLAGNSACLDFYGDPFGEAFSELLDVMRKKQSWPRFWPKPRASKPSSFHRLVISAFRLPPERA